LSRAESDPAYYRKLAAQCRARKPAITRARERGALQRLIAEVS